MTGMLCGAAGATLRICGAPRPGWRGKAWRPGGLSPRLWRGGGKRAARRLQEGRRGQGVCGGPGAGLKLLIEREINNLSMRQLQSG